MLPWMRTSVPEITTSVFRQGRSFASVTLAVRPKASSVQLRVPGWNVSSRVSALSASRAAASNVCCQSSAGGTERWSGQRARSISVDAASAASISCRDARA